MIDVVVIGNCSVIVVLFCSFSILFVCFCHRPVSCVDAVMQQYTPVPAAVIRCQRFGLYCRVYLGSGLPPLVITV